MGQAIGSLFGAGIVGTSFHDIKISGVKTHESVELQGKSYSTHWGLYLEIQKVNVKILVL